MVDPGGPHSAADCSRSDVVPPGFVLDRDDQNARFCGDFFAEVPAEELNEAGCHSRGIVSLL